MITSSPITNASLPTVDIMGLSIHALKMNELLEVTDMHIKSRKSLLLGVVNAAKLINARKDKQLRKSLDESDLILADGLSVVWLSKLLGRALPGRLTGIDIMYRLLQLSDEKKYRVYFLGATADVLEKAIEFVRSNYPALCISGYRDGYFSLAEEKQVSKEIRDSRADILFVAMNSPKKENFLGRWHKLLDVPICHGVGGSFDIMAGLTKRAPSWMQKCGLEWFYRLVQEPGRLWKRYLVTNTMFIVLGLKAAVKARVSMFFHKLRLDVFCGTDRPN